VILKHLSIRGSLGALLVILSPMASQAQSPDYLTGTLTLDEALQLARQHNPTFRATENDAVVADWDVKSAYGSLFPTAMVSGGLSWQGADTGGQQVGGGLTLGDLGISKLPSYYGSSYSLSLNYQLDGNTLYSPDQANRSREATGARIRTAEATLILGVIRAYLAAVRQQDELAQLEVGQVTLLDVRQAEVQMGRAEVNLLRAQTTMETSRLRLLQQIGMDGDALSLEIAGPFELAVPELEFEILWRTALERNPNLESLRASEEAAGVGVKIARSAYYPTLSFRAGLSGWTRQLSTTQGQVGQAQQQTAATFQNCVSINDLYSRLADPLPPVPCGSPLLPDDEIRAIQDENKVWPFDFTKNPASASMTISLPIFQGLGRQRSLEVARIQREDVNLELRGQELALRADLQAGLAAVRAGYQAAILEERNREVSEDQLRLAQERYRVGSASFLDLVESETVLAQANRALLDMIQIYHDAFASLEALVGTSLR